MQILHKIKVAVIVLFFYLFGLFVLATVGDSMGIDFGWILLLWIAIAISHSWAYNKVIKYRKKKETQIKGEVLNPDEEEVDSYIFEVVGESFRNDDGSSRQEIIERHVKEGEPIYLRFYNYKGSLACGVFVDAALTLQIGHIASDDVSDVYDLVTAGHQIDPRIFSYGKASNGLYGVTLTIMVKE